MFHVLVREWHPETWQLGPITEVQISKKCKTAAFSKYLNEKLFPHIPESSFFGSKVTFMKSFYRSDLVLKKWSHMTAGQQQKFLGQGFMEIQRDSVLIIVKDNLKT
jgi:hypothetical protein